jgi:cytochrome c2
MHTRFIALFICLALAPFAWPLPAAPARQITIVPGSAVNGANIFREKGCANCHSFEGMTQGQNPASLAAGLWNHSPEMWRAQAQRNTRPLLDSMETADVFAYFFSLTYVNTPGSADRGRNVFEAKACARCHDTGIGRRLSGPPISTWSEVDDPLSWAERMWNHSKNVYTELSSEGIPWPRFSTGDMVDMLAYLRSIRESPSHAVSFQPGDPEKGRMTFEARCESCHSFGTRTAQPKIDLLQRHAPELLTGYVAEMWNHAPVMRERAGNDYPILGPGDMGNLVAYLFVKRYSDKEGDPKRGAAVFEAKGCASCHRSGSPRRPAIGPDLTASTERYSAVTLSAAVFRHGPEMLETMQKRNIKWPRFSPAEMLDLIGFLNSRLVPHVATLKN